MSDTYIALKAIQNVGSKGLIHKAHVLVAANLALWTLGLADSDTAALLTSVLE